MSGDKVSFKSGIIEVELDSEAAKMIYEDNEIMRDAICIFLNEKAATKNWDIMMDKAEAVKLSKEILVRKGYNKDFLEEVFEGHEVPETKKEER